MKALLPLLLCTACSLEPDASDAAAARGPGVLRADTEAGADAVTRPEWAVGDRFVFSRGPAKIATEVVAADATGYRLRDVQAGVELLYDRDLAELGQDTPKEPRYRITMAPGDPREHWPLWSGKRWEAELALLAPGEGPRRILVRYECDAKETITVPAGTFECYRIWRRSGPVRGERGNETVAVHWYSPKVGHFVKRLENGVLLELAEWNTTGPRASR